MRSSTGQATTEYVAVLALLVLVLAGAGTAIAAPDLPRAVVHQLHVALCIVGGDVCRASDAARRGLEPCVVAGEDHARASGGSFLFLRSSGGETWAVQRRSDGTIALSSSYDQHLGAGAGVGLELGPVISADAEVSGDVGFRSGQTWELANEAELARILHRVHGFDLSNGMHRLVAQIRPPDDTFLEGGGRAGAELSASAIRSLSIGGGDARAALGRRHGRDGTTYYLDLGAATSGPLVDLLPGLDRDARVMAEWHTGKTPGLTLRAAAGGHDGVETETVASLRMDDPADRAAAGRVALLDLDDPGLAVRDLMRRINDHGTVQRFTYRTTTDEHEWAYGVKLGLELGIDHSSSVIRRKLIGAQIVNGVPARRADCLGVD